MYKVLELLTTEGKKNFQMLANGATAIRYRQVFHTDLMLGIAAFSKIDTQTEKVDFELPSKLGYVMNSAAMGEDMNKLSEDGYIKWMEQFEGDTLWNANQQITDIYLVNQTTASKGKK